MDEIKDTLNVILYSSSLSSHPFQVMVVRVGQDLDLGKLSCLVPADLPSSDWQLTDWVLRLGQILNIIKR